MQHPYSDDLGSFAPCPPVDLSTHRPHISRGGYRHNPYSWENATVFCVVMRRAPADSISGAVRQLNAADSSSPDRPQLVRQSKKTACAHQRQHGKCLNGLPAAEQLVRFDNEDTFFHNRGKKNVREPLKFRTQQCSHFAEGHCCLGYTCRMFHDLAQKRSEEDNLRDGIVNDVVIRRFIREELSLRISVEKSIEPVGTQDRGG